MELDQTRYPRVARYISKLPDGLASYPQCLTAVEARKEIPTDFPELGRGEKLPEPIQDFFDGKYTDSWMPETVANAVLLMVRDVCFDTDGEFLAWSRRNNERTFRKPIYRVLMFLLSPSLALMGAAKRWGAFHRGTELEPGKAAPEDGRMKAVLTLTLPPQLFNRLHLDIWGNSYMVALRAANGDNAEYSVRLVDETHAVYHVSWDA